MGAAAGAGGGKTNVLTDDIGSSGGRFTVYV
jgi:hypothetical protein